MIEDRLIHVFRKFHLVKKSLLFNATRQKKDEEAEFGLIPFLILLLIKLLLELKRSASILIIVSNYVVDP